MANRRNVTPKIYQRDIASSFTNDLLPVIQNLTALGYNDTEIGTVVGFAGQLTKDWLRSLMKERQDVAEAIKTGRLLAKSAIIAKLVQASLGYDYEEVDETWMPNGETKSNGQKKWVIAKKIVHKKHQPPNINAVLQLASRLMPDVFRDKEPEEKETSGEHIKKLSGKLLSEISERCRTVVDTSATNSAGESNFSDKVMSAVGTRQGISESIQTVDNSEATVSI